MKGFSQTPYDVTQDKVITKLNQTSQEQAEKVKMLIADSIYQARQILTLTNQGTKIQKEVTALVLRMNDLNNRMTNTENLAAKNEKNILALTIRVNKLTKTSDSLVNQIRIIKQQIAVVNTLEATGVLKLIRKTALSYELRLDSSAKIRGGYMSQFKYNQVEDLNRRMGIQERFNSTLHGNVETYQIPGKARQIIINVK